MNIGILGIGGVGGYFGGLLADRYKEPGEPKIIFIARPSTALILENNGLRLITPDSERVIHPFKIAATAEEVGPLDVLICATKAYDLEDALKPLATCITPQTLILPLLNGVDAKDHISSLFPEANVLDGCVYVNARRSAPAVIQKTGSIEKLYFGNPALPQEPLEKLQQIFRDAGIDSSLSLDIESHIWTKFVFTAGMATSTSYFDESIGEVLKNPGHRIVLTQLLKEAYAVAVARGIALPAEIVETTLEKLSQLPFDGTSSMHRDFRQGGPTEFRSLSKYVADLGDQLGVDTPTFDEVLPRFLAHEQQTIA